MGKIFLFSDTAEEHENFAAVSPVHNGIFQWIKTTIY